MFKTGAASVMTSNIFLFFWKTIDTFRARTIVSRYENKKLPCTRACEASYRTNAMISSSYRRRPRISLTCLCIRRVILAHVRISLDRLGEKSITIDIQTHRSRPTYIGYYNISTTVFSKKKINIQTRWTLLWRRRSKVVAALKPKFLNCTQQYLQTTTCISYVSWSAYEKTVFNYSNYRSNNTKIVDFLFIAEHRPVRYNTRVKPKQRSKTKKKKLRYKSMCINDILLCTICTNELVFDSQ